MSETVCGRSWHRVSPFALQKRRSFRGAKDDNPGTIAILRYPRIQIDLLRNPAFGSFCGSEF